MKEPYFRGLLFLPLEDLAQPFFVNNQHGIPDGPCELAIRELEMLPIDCLTRTMRYKIGLAMRYTACSFDAQELTVTKAIELYGTLAESIGDWMDRHPENTAAFNIDTFLDLYLTKRTDLQRDYVSWFRGRVHAYINGRLSAVPQKGPSPRAFDIEAACAAMLPWAPVLHVDSHVYDQCERGDWTALRPSHILLPSPVLRVQIDGETWLQSVSDPFIRLQTEWLLVDVSEQQWKCYERVHARAVNGSVTPDVTYGAWLDAKTGTYGPIESQMYVPADGAVQTLTCDMKEAGRMFHVLGTLMILFAHPKVRVREIRGGNQAVLELPKGSSVNDLVYEVLKAS